MSLTETPLAGAALTAQIPEYYRTGAARAGNALTQLEDVLIAAHVNPDGDAIGACAACGYILQRLGKRFALYLPGGVPHYLRFIDLPAEPCESFASLPFEPRSALYLDLSDRPRLGPELAGISLPSVNIDHHICPEGLGSIDNFIETSAAATCQLVAYVAMALAMPPLEKIGVAAAAGVLTDTGYFSHGNTSADVFALAAVFQAGGISLPGIWEKLKSNITLARLHLWARLFERTSLDDNGRIASCYVSRADLAHFSCTSEDMEDFVEWLRKIRGVDVAALVREVNVGPREDVAIDCHGAKCKFSLRSRAEVDVREIAASFGGGGHKNAAGGIICAPPEEAAGRLVQAIESSLKSHAF